MDYKADFIAEAHNQWRANINRWRYYLDSYLGGADYQRGKYLTQYRFETADEYKQRVETTPLDNHCKNIISIYNSFLFGKQPARYYANLEQDPSLNSFLKDADLEGRSFDNFMHDANIMASVYGNVWIFVDRPSIQVTTRAEELAQDIRPYVSMISPENVMDWNYSRAINGAYYLDYVKVLEHQDTERTVIKLYYLDRTETIEHIRGEEAATIVDIAENPYGVIPAVILYSSRSPERGVGISDIADISDIQRAIYNELSEVEQLIRISNHPSLVKTASTEAVAGAGAVITMDETLPGDLKPYLLQPNSQSLDGIQNSIREKINAIDRIAHMGGVRATSTRTSSGVALQVENQLLNAKLTEKANNLELAEEQIWRMWAMMQGYAWTGEVEYPNNFNLRDKITEIDAVKRAVDTQLSTPRMTQEMRRMVASILFDDGEIVEYVMEDLGSEPETPAAELAEHPQLTAENYAEHVQEMIQEGYTMAEIAALHPELLELLINERTG